MSITFGSDPEFLIVNKGVPKSAIGVVQGNPDNRINIKGHEFYYDNVLAECAIKPGKSKEETLFNFREALQIYVDMVKPFELMAVACAEFPDWELEHEKAREVGCSPDWCAYELKLMDPPKEIMQSSPLRSCGGHIHLGCDIFASDGPEPILGVLMMDLFLGVPSVWLDADINSVKRRTLYGQSGRYRPKDYGFEYRSLSNFWLRSPDLVSLVYDLSMFVVHMVESKKAWDLWTFNEDLFFEAEDPSTAWKCTGYDSGLLKIGINNGSKLHLLNILDKLKLWLPNDLRERVYAQFNNTSEIDIRKNWNLN